MDDNAQGWHHIQQQEEEQMSTTPQVYAAINKVQAALATEGISKNRKNEAQGYKFRGIDDVYNAVSRLLATHGLCIMPRCTERTVVERVSDKGKALFYVTVRCEFDFIAAADGSKHTVVTYGEAMDSADKATNKAMSAAYKYALMQAFAIPTEGDNDADASHHELGPAPLTDRQRAEIKAQMQKAATIDQLREQLRAAMQAAAAVNDAEAHADFKAHGEALAKELAKPANEPEKAAA